MITVRPLPRGIATIPAPARAALPVTPADVNVRGFYTTNYNPHLSERWCTTPRATATTVVWYDPKIASDQLNTVAQEPRLGRLGRKQFEFPQEFIVAPLGPDPRRFPATPESPLSHWGPVSEPEPTEGPRRALPVVPVAGLVWRESSIFNEGPPLPPTPPMPNTPYILSGLDDHRCKPTEEPRRNPSPPRRGPPEVRQDAGPKAQRQSLDRNALCPGHFVGGALVGDRRWNQPQTHRKGSKTRQERPD